MWHSRVTPPAGRPVEVLSMDLGVPAPYGVREVNN